ncbi:hypothetical protein [Methanocella conradii]|uniref:hypothetical protein n=1 Tax=Methanocella conradii TaxID=1175444 RepID=UPI00157C7203|nr:hypothetical protein [Methanocella conradii]
MPSRKTVKKAADKEAVETVKVAAGKEAAEKPAEEAKADATKFSVPPKVLLEMKAESKGETIEGLIKERNIQLKSVEEYLGIQQKQDFHSKPIIPGVYDLLIPPGTPRKLIIKLAKEYPIQIVRRDDIYVPIGVCDIERELLAIRGDEKTIKKMEKLLRKEIEAFIEGRDARLHDYSKPIELEGIKEPAPKPPKKSRKAK